MKVIKLIVVGVVGLPIALFLVVLLLTFILGVSPFVAVGFIFYRYFKYREEKKRMELKTEVKKISLQNPFKHYESIK